MKQIWAAFPRVSVRTEDCDSVLELIRMQLDPTLLRGVDQTG